MYMSLGTIFLLQNPSTRIRLRCSDKFAVVLFLVFQNNIFTLKYYMTIIIILIRELHVVQDENEWKKKKTKKTYIKVLLAIEKLM